MSNVQSQIIRTSIYNHVFCTIILVIATFIPIPTQSHSNSLTTLFRLLLTSIITKSYSHSYSHSYSRSSALPYCNCYSHHHLYTLIAIPIPIPHQPYSHLSLLYCNSYSHLSPPTHILLFIHIRIPC